MILVLEVKVVDGDESSSHELRFEGLTEFHFANGIPLPWDYAEVTELHFDRETYADRWRFEVVLWSEAAGMTGRCGAIRVDGAELYVGD